uniref:PH domain-containing protein n=2 Tax=Clastoptera arizonana TaxID=38151 RepID=A0A1B6CH99_9HEMI
MKNMIRRRKKKIKKKSLNIGVCEQHHVFNLHLMTFNKMEMSTEMMCQLYEGQLYKYTNVMKGWQFRWFILDPKTGILNYFLSENESKQQPRGWIHLEGAVISPSDEDSNTFTVNSTSGEMFKLRAQDARARQEWVNRLRAVAELHAAAITHNNASLSSRDHGSSGVGNANTSSGPLPCSIAVWDALTAVRDHLFRADQSHCLLARSVDELPSGGEVRHVDPDLLLLKAASQAMLMSLSQCLYILQQQHQASAYSDCRTTSPHPHLLKNHSVTGLKNTETPSCSTHSKKKYAL